MTNSTQADTTHLLDIVRGVARELRPGAKASTASVWTMSWSATSVSTACGLGAGGEARKNAACERRFFTTGAGGRNRTGDLRITNALLYQLSYAGEKQRAL